MHEERRSAGAGEGGRNLAADVPGLAHAQHHHSPLTGQQALCGAHEGLIYALDEGRHGARLDVEDGSRQ